MYIKQINKSFKSIELVIPIAISILLDSRILDTRIYIFMMQMCAQKQCQF